jgi:benzoate/toluate 1,2-dioxygenase reductase subunit
MSNWLRKSAVPGDRMRFVGPAGTFFLRDVTRPVVMLAGGTGLAPFLSMLEVLAEKGTTQPVHLIYGVTRDEDLVECDRVEMLAARLPTMTWSTVVAENSSAHPLKGFVTHHLEDAHLNAGDCDVYLCGPPPMVEAVRLFLREKGVVPAHFFYEKFTASEPVSA